MSTRVIVCLLCMVVAALFFEREHFGMAQREVTSNLKSPLSQPQVLPETRIQIGPATNPAQTRDIQSSENPTEIRLTPENRAEMDQCGLSISADAVTLDDVIHSLTQKAGKIEKQGLIWRNIHFLAQDGEEQRLRIWKEFSQGESGKLKVQLFTLDEEGLPVPVKEVEEELSNPTPSSIEKYLSGKSVRETQQKLKLSFGDPRHLALILETKNGRVRSFEAKDDGIDFQCFTAPDANFTDCKCLSNKASR